MPDYLLELILTIATPLAAALGAWLAAEVIRWLRAHVSHVQTREALERATVAVSSAVGEVAQVYVSDLKSASEDGALTSDEANEAQSRALAAARDYLGPKGVAMIRATLGSDERALDRWLVALIEERIASSKEGCP
jgi:hypothetical protein